MAIFAPSTMMTTSPSSDNPVVQYLVYVFGRWLVSLQNCCTTGLLVEGVKLKTHQRDRVAARLDPHAHVDADGKFSYAYDLRRRLDVVPPRNATCDSSLHTGCVCLSILRSSKIIMHFANVLKPHCASSGESCTFHFTQVV